MSSQREDEILEFIKDFIASENMAPSVREICDGVGIRSTSTVHRYLHRLVEEGRIHMSTGKNRAIVITDGSSNTSLGIPLVGYFSHRVSDGVLDPLYIDCGGHPHHSD